MSAEKITYFMCSDLHGISPTPLINALNEKRFEGTNKNHILVVAGDITDGGGYTNELIDFLKNLHSQKRAIIIKGNHDRGMYLQLQKVTRRLSDIKDLFLDGDDSMDAIRKGITKENIKWLESLPEQIETEHFYLAHGMGIRETDIPGRRNVRVMSTWGSPVLLEGLPHHFFGQGINAVWCARHLKNKYPSLKVYEQSFDKDLYVGHFQDKAVEAHIENFKIKGFEYIDGFPKFGKIHFLDRNTKFTGVVEIFVKEY